LPADAQLPGIKGSVLIGHDTKVQAGRPDQRLAAAKKRPVGTARASGAILAAAQAWVSPPSFGSGQPPLGAVTIRNDRCAAAAADIPHIGQGQPLRQSLRSGRCSLRHDRARQGWWLTSRPIPQLRSATS
jgi:hypothetical protein